MLCNFCYICSDGGPGDCGNAFLLYDKHLTEAQWGAHEFPPHFFPSLQEITLELYYILHQGNFMNFLNSVLVSGITVAIIAAFVAAALGFCIARFRFPGRSFLFLFIMSL